MHAKKADINAPLWRGLMHARTRVWRVGDFVLNLRDVASNCACSCVNNIKSISQGLQVLPRQGDDPFCIIYDRIKIV